MPFLLLFFLVFIVRLRILFLFLTDEDFFIDIFLFILLIILLNNNNGTSFFKVLIPLKIVTQVIVDISQEHALRFGQLYHFTLILAHHEAGGSELEFLLFIFLIHGSSVLGKGVQNPRL